MEISKKGKSFLSAPLGVGLKILITALCLWYVSLKIDFHLTVELFSDSNKAWLVCAIILFITSKIVSSYRLNIYFQNINVSLSQRQNLKLYWLGMFYNLFLPGGIGGDAYKVILLNRRDKHPVKKLTAAVLLDRLSGIAGLSVLAAFFYFLTYQGEEYSYWILASIIPGSVVYFFVIKTLFPDFINSFWITFLLGLLVQFLQVLCIYTLMASVEITTHQYQYVFLFLLSSIVAILPFTVGGLGAREVVFLWGSEHFLLDSHQSIYISLLFYLITLVVSFIGVRWVYRSPLD